MGEWSNSCGYQCFIKFIPILKWGQKKVGYEFYKNKDKVISDTYKEYDVLLKKINDELSKINKEIEYKKNSRLKCRAELKTVITEFQNKVSEILQQEKNQKESIRLC